MTKLMQSIGAVLFAVCLMGATTGTDANQIKTAKPAALDLTKNQPADAREGVGVALPRADHRHAVTGVLKQPNGGTGAGVLTCTPLERVTSNGTAYSCAAIPGAGTVGQAAPSTVLYAGGQDTGGVMAGLKVCDRSAAITRSSGTAAGTLTTVIAGAASKKIHICGLFVLSDSQVDLKFTESADACATSAADVTGLLPLPPSGGFSLGLSSYAQPFTAQGGDSLCLSVSAQTALGGWISYTQQ